MARIFSAAGREGVPPGAVHGLATLLQVQVPRLLTPAGPQDKIRAAGLHCRLSPTVNPRSMSASDLTFTLRNERGEIARMTALMEQFCAQNGLSDDDTEKISWRNVARFCDYDPFAVVPREQATVGALRAQATGEGLHETLRRKRLERAALLLRNTDAPPADIALATGFCDQSHMIRGFRAVLGRTPLEVRAEREFLSRFS